MAEFHGIHVVILCHGFPDELLAGGCLAGNEALAAHAAKEVFAGVAWDGERGLAVADSVDEEFGLYGVVNEGVEDDAGEILDDGLADARSEGCAAAFSGVEESTGVLTGAVDSEGGVAGIQHAALGADFLPAGRAINAAR